jgi:hypothetical protein
VYSDTRQTIERKKRVVEWQEAKAKTRAKALNSDKKTSKKGGS